MSLIGRKILSWRAMIAAVISLVVAALFLALPRLGDLSTAAGERWAQRKWEVEGRVAAVRRCADRLTIELCRTLASSEPMYDVSTATRIEQQFWHGHQAIKLFNGSGYAPNFGTFSIGNVGDKLTLSRGYSRFGSTKEGADNFNAVAREERLTITAANVRPYILFYLMATVSLFNLKGLNPTIAGVVISHQGDEFAAEFEYVGRALRIAVKSDGTIHSSNIGAS